MIFFLWGFLRGAVVKTLPASAGDTRGMGSIPVLGISPEVGNGNSFQYSYLESSMDRGALWATVHGLTKNQTRWSTHTYHITLNRAFCWDNSNN